MSQTTNINWLKYFLAFIITAVIFATALFLSNYFGQKKIDEIRSIQDKISIDILSSETQFSLLESSACRDIGTSTLSSELGSLGDKLSITESDRGATDNEVETLKRYYSLLEIKDYLLMNQITAKCKKTPLSIIYFYSTDEGCSDCQREGYVLDELRKRYPGLRVYSFDYNLDLSAVKTLIKIYKIQNKLPAIYINDKIYYGFQSVSDLETAVPELATLNKSQKTATSTSGKKIN